MIKWGCVLVLVAACTQVALAEPHVALSHAQATSHQAAPTSTPVPVPTVAIVSSTPVTVPTVTIPRPKPTPTPKPKKPKTKPKANTKALSPARVPGTWIWAYLTSYCPGSAGWLSSSGAPVFYGMLANDFYRFGTRVYIPIIGIVGVVEDHVGDYSWNHFDVWSAVCYSTPTGYFKVKVLK